MREIDTLLCDLGDVLFLYDNQRTAQALVPHSLLPGVHEGRPGGSTVALEARIQRIYKELFSGMGRRYFDAFMRGGVDGAMYASWIFHSLRLVPSYPEQDIRRAYVDVFTRNERAIRGVQRLKQLGVRTVAASNLDPWRHEHVRKLGLDSLFDALCLSYEIGQLKPHHAFYHQAIAIAGCDPQRTLFVDDKLANVEAARACGLRAELYDVAQHQFFLALVAREYAFVRAS